MTPQEPVTPRLHCAWLVYRGEGMEAKVGLHRCHGDVKTDDELQGDTIDYLGSTFTFHHSRRLNLLNPAPIFRSLPGER